MRIRSFKSPTTLKACIITASYTSSLYLTYAALNPFGQRFNLLGVLAFGCTAFFTKIIMDKLLVQTAEEKRVAKAKATVINEYIDANLAYLNAGFIKHLKRIAQASSNFNHNNDFANQINLFAVITENILSVANNYDCNGLVINVNTIARSFCQIKGHEDFTLSVADKIIKDQGFSKLTENKGISNVASLMRMDELFKRNMQAPG